MSAIELELTSGTFLVFLAIFLIVFILETNSYFRLPILLIKGLKSIAKMVNAINIYIEYNHISVSFNIPLTLSGPSYPRIFNGVPSPIV